MRIYNETKNRWLLQRGKLKNHFWGRFLGLMGKKSLAENEGLILYPTNAIHCFFMHFPIDVVYVDRNNRVVDIDRRVQPWRVGRPRRNARYVIEMPAGKAAATATQPGDKLRWEEER